MDISDIVEPPAEETPPEQQVQKKPYWQVVDDYRQAQSSSPEIQSMSLPQFAQKSNEVLGTNEYDEGLNDSTLRRLGGGITRGLHHFGGMEPGESAIPGVPSTANWPSLSKVLGGPQEGVDLPALAGKGGEALARGVGAPEWAVQAAKTGAEALPETAVTVGAATLAGLVPGGQPAVLPILGGLSGLSTYGETGRVLPAAISGITAAALPKVMEASGQAVLGKLGAKTVGELRPDLMNILSKEGAEGAKVAEDIGGQFSPVGLVQRTARLGASQAGMLGATKASELAQIAVEPDMSWQDKLAQAGQAFSPSGLAASAIQQLPFTAMDVVGERTHPMKRLESAIRENFDTEFNRGWQATRQTPEGVKPPPPTKDELQQAWDASRGVKPVQSKNVGEVLESMGQLPIKYQGDDKPVRASDGIWNTGTEAVNEVRERANSKLLAQDLTGNITTAQDPGIHQHIRIAEFEGGTKEEIANRAANTVVDAWLGDQKNISAYDAVNAPGEDPTLKTQEVNKEIAKALGAEVPDPNMPVEPRAIWVGDEKTGSWQPNPNYVEPPLTMKVDKTSPNYDQGAHQRLSVALGNADDRKDAGIVGDVNIGDKSGAVRPLSDSIVNDLLGRKSSMGDLQRLPREIIELENEINTELVRAQTQGTLPGFESVVDPTFSNSTLDRLRATLEIRNKQLEEAKLRSQGHGLLDMPKGASVLPTAKATSAAAEAAFNYGKPGTKSAGKVLDVTNPKSVGEFYKVVVGAIRQAETDVVRRWPYWTGGRARETFHEDPRTGEVVKLKSKPAADGLAEQLANDPNKPPNIEYRVARTPEADGTWRVVKMEYPEVRSLDEKSKVGEKQFEAGQLPEEVALAEAPDEDSTEGIDPNIVAATGADPTQIAAEPISQAMFTLNQLGGSASSLGRKAAMTQNVVDYVKGLSNGEIEAILKAPKGASTIQQANVLKQRYMRFMQFLRDNGDVKLLVTKEKEAPVKVHNTFTISEAEKMMGGARIPSEQELAARKTLSENIKARLVISKEEGGQMTFTPKGGETQGLGAPTITTYKVVTGGQKEGTITVRGVGDLEALNRYLQVGDENRPDRGKLGYKDAESLNRGKAGGLNFFEQFYWLSQKIRQERPDPRIYGQERWIEARPMGNWQFVPPGFVDDYMNKLLVDWPKEMSHPIAVSMSQFPTVHSLEKPGKLTLSDATGKSHTYDVPFNPLVTLYTKGIKDQLLIPAKDLVEMHRRYGGGELLTGDEKVQFDRWMDMAQKLVKAFPFIGNQMVGFGVTKDPYTHGLFHTDKTTGSSGILLNPTIPDERGRKFARLMRPTEVFPHLLEELAHTGVDFAYKLDPVFRAEVDKIFKSVKDHQQFMVTVSGGPNSSVYDNMHSLSRPEELLAGMFKDGNLHTLLKGMKDDLGDLPWGAPATGSFFDRIMQLIRNLFERIFSPEETGTMLDRMAKTASRGLDIQSMMNLQNRKGIHGETVISERLLPQRPTILERGGPQVVPTARASGDAWPFNLQGQPRQLTTTELWKDKKSQLADAEAKLKNLQGLLYPTRALVGTHEPGMYDPLIGGKATEPFRSTGYQERPPQEDISRAGVTDVGGQRLTVGSNYYLSNIDRVTAERDQARAELERVEAQLKAESPQGEALESRLGLLMPTIGNKAKALEDQDLKQLFREFAGRAPTVIDAFSGSGKVTEAMKDLGARTVLNVKDPRYFQLFKEVKDNPEDFANRVQQAVAPIEAPREGKEPYMKDGSDLRVYLNNLQAQDPTVALLIQAQFNPRGREVVEGQQTAMRAQVTTFGLNRLPETIRNLSPKIDRLSSVDGWTAARNARAGQGVVVDPPYVNSTNSYAVGGRRIRPEERIADYQRAVLPAAQRGAHFLIFDNADPKLMSFLEQNGFQVHEFTRPRATQAEFVATNSGGEALESRARVPAGKVYDIMNSAATHSVADWNDDLWFKPYDLNYFRNTFAPAFGDKMKLEQRGGQWGYRMDGADLGKLTEMDINRMPPPQLKPGIVSAFETFKSLFRADGSSVETAEALAADTLQTAALLKNTDQIYWGMIPDEASNVAGRTWTSWKVVGMAPASARYDTAGIARHESAHGAGIADIHPPDVVQALMVVNHAFAQLTPELRKEFLEDIMKLSDKDSVKNLQVYQAAINDPTEFAAEYMQYVGSQLSVVPNPSQYLKDIMRFAPDDISHMVKLQTLRKMQSIDRLNSYLSGEGKDPRLAQVAGMLKGVFEGMARSALDIAVDQSEFYRTRGMYPDLYKQYLKALGENLEKWAAQKEVQDIGYTAPKLGQDEVLMSREGPVIDYIREFFHLPTSDGRLPMKRSFWDRTMTQFSQLALKYPALRSFADMFMVSRGMTREAQQKLDAGMAGVYDAKNRLISDARTQDVATFEASPRLREAWSKVALMMNKLLDNRYNAELGKAEGDKLKIDPQKVTGWLTSGWFGGALTKQGITDPNDQRVLQTIFQGTRNQIRTAGEFIIRGQTHAFESLIAKAIATHSNINPESAREVAQKISQGAQLLKDDPQNAMRLIGEASVTIDNPRLFGQMLDIAEKSWADVADSERFLSLRQPAYSSERRPGRYGVFWEDAKGKIQSHYDVSEEAINKYVVKNNITPDRFSYPSQDQNWGVSPALFEQMDNIHKRMMERFSSLFTEKEVNDMGSALDMSTNLRDELNSRDILKLTTHRNLAPGREELDMWDTHRHYLNALTNGLKNRFIKNEAALLFSAPEFDMQPGLKQQVQGQIQTLMAPDSALGSRMQQLGFLYYLFANPSSMIMQLSHQVMGLAPMLTRMGQSVTGSYGTIAKANMMVQEARRRGGVFKDAQVDALVRQAEREGGIQSWLSREVDHAGDMAIANRLRVTSGQGMMKPFDLLKNRVYQGYRLLRQLYDVIPTYNSKVAFVAAVLHLRSSKNLTGPVTGEQLYKDARFMQSNTMYPGGKENRPGFFQYLPRSAAQMLWSLQTYANGLTTEMGELVRKSFQTSGMSAAQTKQVRKAAAQMLIAQTAVAGVLGLPFAEIMLATLQKIFPEHDVEGSVRETLQNLTGDDDALGNAVSTSLMTGIPSAMDYAPDVGSRFALHGVFHVSPYHGVGWQELMGASGGIFQNMFDAGQAGMRGEPMQGVQKLMPNGFRRIWKSLEQGNTYTTEGGKMLVNDLRPEEIVARAIGFTPSRIARIQEFERLSQHAMAAEKLEQTNWSKKQANLMMSGQDDVTVQQNIAQRVAESKGVYTPPQLANDIAKEYEAKTMPEDLRKFGNRATVLSQKSLRGALGTQSETPGSLERLQLQGEIAQRLGLGGPSTGSLRRASNIDQLTSLYPNLTHAQASLLLSHAASSQPTPDLYQELLTAGE